MFIVRGGGEGQGGEEGQVCFQEGQGHCQEGKTSKPPLRFLFTDDVTQFLFQKAAEKLQKAVQEGQSVPKQVSNFRIPYF